MKRITTMALILMGVFLIGFWAGRSPALMTVETAPSRQALSSMDFLRQELEKARAENLRESTAETKQRVEDLERKLTTLDSFR